MKTPAQPILLLEDDHVDVLTTRRALKEIHVDNPLVVCENGEQGLAWLRDAADPPCLVLLDLNMPVMNGIEFLEQVKRDEQLRRIPMVVLTTSEEMEDKVRSFDLGIAGYMAKSLDYRRFVEAMRSIDAYWTTSEQP
ncbi:response regulator [Telluria mixta]|uniref:Response regulator n=1 Tax=Telluria mixta TaxID=34071 RepID=A0ABT2BSZ2_9BURK|nr:response regulator [Telluria mixta]MCS0628240.1 response regulator [Telluria mixta]WEM93646.1 response regulator [Telluria mixta]